MSEFEDDLNKLLSDHEEYIHLDIRYDLPIFDDLKKEFIKKWEIKEI